MLFPDLLNPDLGLFLLRLAVGLVFLPHGLGKLKNIQGMAQGMGMPSGAVLMLGSVEFFSGLGMILGVYTQLAAILLGIVMVGAIGMKTIKWKVPFISINQPGWEFDLTLLAANLAILLTGGGSIALL